MTLGHPLPWSDVEAVLDGMLGRRYYTNHGPLARDLEAALCQRSGYGHAVIATNPAIGLVMLLEGLGLSGSVLVPALAPAWHASAVRWAELDVRFFDVDKGFVTEAAVAAAVDDRCSGLLCGPQDSFADVFGLSTCRVGWCGSGSRVPSLVSLPGMPDGPLAACVLCDDGVLASRVRNIRSSYGAGVAVPVNRTANGRVSEAQAGLALAQLDRVFGDAARGR